MSDSVGKISLDLEVKSDLQGQINKVSNNIAKGLKNSLQGTTKGIFNGLENGLKKTTGNINKAVGNSMSNLKNNIKNTLSGFSDIKIKTPKIEFNKPKNETIDSNPVKATKATRGPPVNLEQISSQISNTENVLDNINARIDQQRTKLAQLKESYNQAFEGARKNKLQEQMLKTEATINRLIGQSDKLGFKLAGLDDKLAAMKSMSSNASEGTGKLNKSISNIGNITNKASNGGNRLKNAFKGLSSGTKSANNSFRGASNGLSIFMGTMLKWGIIFPIIQRGITAMAKGLYNNLMTNQAFANSLAQIKTNLMVAFTPIYYAILPAINALMSALSTITGMIASFTSAIFGTTYKASLGATQGLIDAKDAMGAYGDSAKKTAKDIKGILAPFDEINQLQSNSDDGGGGGAGGGNQPVLAPVDTSSYDAAMQKLADKLKHLMEPILNAWEKEGQNTINAIKYALSSVWELIKSIGRSFEEVWLNGTGEETCTLILQILQNIFNIIGDIATAFNNAWNANNTGTQIIQNIWNSLNNVLQLLKNIGDNFRNAWNDNGAGEALCESLLGLLKSISGVLDDVTKGIADSFGKATESLFPVVIEFCTQISNGLSNLADGFKIIWDNGGQVLFDGIVQLIDKVAELAMAIVGDAFVNFSSIFKDVLAPAIGLVSDVIGIVVQKLSEFIDWINSNQSLIGGLTLAFTALFACFEIGKISQMVEICGSLSTALLSTHVSATLSSLAVGALSTVTTIWNGICAIASGVTTALGVAFNFLISPIGLVVLAITAVIAIGYLLVKNWDWIKEKCNEVWTWIQEKFQAFKDWLEDIFTTDWSNKFGVMGNVLNGFLQLVSGIWNSIKQIFGGIIDFIAGVFTGNWSRAWQGVVNIFGGIFSGLGAIIKAPINAVIGIVNGAISAINSISFDVPDWIPGIGGSHFGPNIGKIPYLARGGIVNQPTLAMVGEAGKEAVMPLEHNTGWIDNLAGQVASKLNGGSTGGKQPLIVNVYQDGVLTTQKVIDDINEITKGNGGVCPINI